MQKLKNDLKSLAGDLKKLTKKTDMMIKKVQKLEKKLAVKKPKRKIRGAYQKSPILRSKSSSSSFFKPALCKPKP